MAEDTTLRSPAVGDHVRRSGRRESAATSANGSTARRTPVTQDSLRIVPANEATWQDVQDVFDGADSRRCQCQRFKVVGWIWRDSTWEQRTAMLREQTACDFPLAAETGGLIAYVEDQPAGWVAVEPRTAYPKLRTLRVPWSGRQEDKDDPDVWAVTCFVVRKRYRGRGLTYPLARAAVDFARERGARALEAYPMVTEPGKEITWGELHVGARQVFEEAGFEEVSHPSVRRFVMRIDFGKASASAEHEGSSMVAETR
jgi:GNAT superfamily N-acetyltransferase